MAGELGQQTVELGAVVRRAAEDSYLALRELVEKSRVEAEGKNGQQRSDTEKKIDLLKFIDRTRQRMLRLHVLAKWCQQVPLVHYCQQLASTLSSHETCFTQTADSLFFMHEGLQQARAPIFDVPSAIEVLHTGSYRRVPKCVEEIGTQNTLFQDEQKPTLKKLSTLVDGEFKVLITLGYRGHFSLWRILHMELVVGEKAGPIKLEETRRYALGDDIERRMAVADNPFMILYTILHELCISLVMDTVIRQTNVLRQGRWKDAIKSELISDIGTGQGGSNAVMQLGQDGELDSSGSRIPDKEADLSIDLSCIDVEALILKAIACNRHTRLLEIQRELMKNVQMSQSSTEVILKREVHGEGFQKRVHRRDSNDCCTNEMLQVRAYGQSYIDLGINISNTLVKVPNILHYESIVILFHVEILDDMEERGKERGNQRATNLSPGSTRCRGRGPRRWRSNPTPPVSAMAAPLACVRWANALATPTVAVALCPPNRCSPSIVADAVSRVCRIVVLDHPSLHRLLRLPDHGRHPP
ncbi:hypothetical protein OsI_28829 [Oryza sativa Indica Group]|uniref:Mediator of RNA polymerase II transcription subunit 14 n=1 Tax=Oryza sativa subsp. indica TaxID=39946 RepID=B8B9T5_ORYSI|nr:hypothetical protein OsI_28829 [Oryza sativa Indica Group]